jgi:DNA repair protein RadC
VADALAVEPQEPFAKYVRSPKEAQEMLAPCFRGSEDEKIALLHLDGNRQVLALCEYPGSTDAADLPLRAIIEEALRLGSTELIVAHNHPSGDPQPSVADLMASRRLSETARNLGLRLVDHLIFAGEESRSLRDLGLL